MDDELSEFRDRWKQELETREESQGTQTKEEMSIDLYRQALFYEREGQPFKAVRFYRKAFKLNPTLEHSREAQLNADFLSLTGEPSKGPAAKTPAALSQPTKQRSLDSKQHLAHIPQWAEHFVGSLCERPDPKEEEEENEPTKNEEVLEIHIGDLPPEVFIHILSFITAVDVESCSAVCRLWYLLARENNLWKNICLRQWPSEFSTLQDQVQEQLSGNWRRLFIDKPRPRLDGVYISQNSYIRSGQTEGIYDQPVFKIRYWRYIRFFKDGNAVLICSPKNPKMIVPHLRYGATSILGGKEFVDKGHFEILDENIISESKIFIESTKHTSEANFCYLLRLANSYNGWHDRLLVEDYYTEEHGLKNSFRKDFIRTYKFLPLPKSFYDIPDTTD